jgi:hypothetical protein
LLAHAFLWTAIRWVEGVVTAEGAASGADLAIAVRAAETSVDADFLYTTAELAREVRVVAVETPIVTPREHCFNFCKNTKKFRVDSLKLIVVEKFKVF